MKQTDGLPVSSFYSPFVWQMNAVESNEHGDMPQLETDTPDVKSDIIQIYDDSANDFAWWFPRRTYIKPLRSRESNHTSPPQHQVDTTGQLPVCSDPGMGTMDMLDSKLVLQEQPELLAILLTIGHVCRDVAQIIAGYAMDVKCRTLTIPPRVDGSTGVKRSHLKHKLTAVSYLALLHSDGIVVWCTSTTKEERNHSFTREYQRVDTLINLLPDTPLASWETRLWSLQGFTIRQAGPDSLRYPSNRPQLHLTKKGFEIKMDLAISTGATDQEREFYNNLLCGAFDNEIDRLSLVLQGVLIMEEVD
jgi:hypothetical protein